MNTALPNLPSEAPLKMTLQKLEGNPPGSIEVTTTPHGLLAKRLLLIAATGVLGMAASTEVRFALSRDGLDFFEILLLLLFVPLFCWIAFGFVSSTMGFLKLMTGDHPGFTAITGKVENTHHRTAVLMPVYNEGVEAVMGRVEAMTASIAAAGVGPQVDFFILSDSNPEHGKEEWAAWEAMAPHAPINVYYRRREKNIARKPGNISEWLERFGSAYEYMVILDADSLMSGDAISGMISIMEKRPSIGLLQTVPMTINARTVFQRWMQFAGYAYGPIASAGLLWWSGSEANFWGHNAIVRVKAFAESCGLPQLGGKPPFGGHILSHDMVESALLRRRGWAVHMLMIDGSYEEFPPTIVDNAIRDRRWMQGNLQHLRLLDAPGLHWASRMHLLIGASAYLTSPAWLVLILTAIAQVAFEGQNPITESTPPSVLWLTIVLLFGPKLMGLTWLLSNKDRRQRYGGAASIIKSVLLEIPLAVLLAPVSMVNQLLALGEVLLGRSSGWNAQSREAKGLTVGDVLPNLKPHILLGLAFAATVFIDPITAAWLSPLTIGLLTSPWLVSMTSNTGLGAALGRKGYFQVPPPINVGHVPSELT
ncbi:glucans biosynthesis glucosyltransferase MdoH [Altererythrobacter indicus]|uniref:Glucans biosynthesis glucosyltransferase H n=1 Tax=Altericroceibacterium indicum TaxID=374177 RepID=A0A845A8J6_9SPHN|nr:glucans biosynthesis glucosyltransferase MdoH [Altericroceibacterium indicum]MXP25573.1 glucans biosynthesis glucosyltransferase MdoH [Altericroceibacterium indicum]